MADPERDLMEPEHEAFRRTVRTFVEREVVPHHPEWETAGQVPRSLWRAAGDQGLLCFDVPEEYGGPGVEDYRYHAVVGEELARAGAGGPGFVLHSDVVVPYLTHLGTPEQKARWLPGCVAGTTVTAVAMTEPGAGSDLQGIRTTAVDRGDHFLVNGAKTYLSNGLLADLVVVVCRTGEGSRGLSLLVLERGQEGMVRGGPLRKMGLRAQDTAELFLDDVRVPRQNLLGGVGEGFAALMAHLPQERLSIAVGAAASCERILDLALTQAREREAFGRPIGSFGSNRHLLAKMATEVRVCRVFVDDCIRRHLAGRLDAPGAAMVKWWATELQQRLADRALQLHGGLGYMLDHPVARAFLDARVQTIYGGTTEIQKEIIGRSLGLAEPPTG